MNNCREGRPRITIVEQNATIINLIRDVCTQQQIELRTYNSWDELRDRPSSNQAGCIVAGLPSSDVGLDAVYDVVHSSETKTPLIFLGEDIDTRLAIRAMERGAMTVIPLEETASKLPQTLLRALEFARYQQQLEQRRFETEEVLNAMTSRQREVLLLIVHGLPTKQIAARLHISQRLVEKERSHILRLFNVGSTPNVTYLLGEYEGINRAIVRFDCKPNRLLCSWLVRLQNQEMSSDKI